MNGRMNEWKKVHSQTQRQWQTHEKHQSEKQMCFAGYSPFRV